MERGIHRAAHYDPDRARAFHLGILTGQGLSAVAVHDIDSGELQCLVWGSGMEPVKDPAIPSNPRTVTHVALPEWSTLVPDGAMGAGSKDQFLALVHDRLPTTGVKHEPVRTIGGTCLYANEETHLNEILQRFPNARSLPLQGILVRTAQVRSAKEPLVLIHRGFERVDIAVAKDHELLLSNSYAARTPEDLLYFCLLVANGTGIAPATLRLETGGTHLVQEERELLSRYFPRHTTAAPALSAPSSSLGPADRWFAALSQFGCAS